MASLAASLFEMCENSDLAGVATLLGGNILESVDFYEKRVTPSGKSFLVSPLSIAIRNGDLEMVKLLLSHGAKKEDVVLFSRDIKLSAFALAMGNREIMALVS